MLTADDKDILLNKWKVFYFSSIDENTKRKKCGSIDRRNLKYRFNKIICIRCVIQSTVLSWAAQYVVKSVK